MSSGLGCLRLAVSKRGVCLIESCLGSSGLALGGVELGLGRLDVDTLSLASAASYAVFAAAVPDLAFSYSPLAVFMFTSAAVKASWAHPARLQLRSKLP